MARQVERRSVADLLAARISERIITGALQPGQYLPSERTLADEVGVNRQAVREALQQLRQLGMVEISQGIGVRVLDWAEHAHFSVLYDSLFAPDGSLRFDHVTAVLRMRVIAMADAARLAARRRTDQQLAELDRLVAEMEAEPADAPVVPRFEIWGCITDASHNIAHRLTFTSQLLVAERLPPDIVVALAAGARMVAEYRQLVEAVRAHDSDGAEHATRDILGAVLHQLGEAL